MNDFDYLSNGTLFSLYLSWNENRNLTGVLKYYTKEDEKTVPFSDLAEMLLCMEAICDEKGYPPRDTVLHTVLEQTPPWQKRVAAQKHNVKAHHFVVLVTRRQNASMQGYFKALDRSTGFRSCIELLKQIYEVMMFIENDSPDETG